MMCLADSYKLINLHLPLLLGGHTWFIYVPPAFGENFLGEKNTWHLWTTEAGGLSRLVKSIEAKVQEHLLEVTMLGG